MLFIRILNFIRGYLIISICGSFPERFINICIHRGILLWDVTAYRDKYTAKISTKDFLGIRSIAYITHTRTRIEKRMGIPFILKRYRKRWPLVFGILIFFFIIWFTSTRIMSVSIVGNERIPTERLYSELAEVGVSFGEPVSGINADTVRNEMIVMDDDIAWLGVNVRGSRVYIEITERVDTESIPHLTDDITNVIASRDGIITRTEVKQGQTMIKIGDAVRSGDVLVSGIMDSVYGGYRAVHAYGDVYAKTEYSLECEYPTNYDERIYTGETKTLLGVSLMGRELDLYLPFNVPSGNFEEKTDEFIGSVDILGFNIELGGIKKTYSEYTEAERERTVTETAEYGAAELTRELDEVVPDTAEIIERRVEHNIVSGDTVSVRVTYICEENIAKLSIIDKSLIDKSENLDYDKEDDNED